MLTFVGILPHAPILIPEVRDSHYKKAAQTISAMRKLAAQLNATMVDTVIFLLPPDPLKENSKRLVINLDRKARGDMSKYGNWKVQAEINLDTNFGLNIIQKSHENHPERSKQVKIRFPCHCCQEVPVRANSWRKKLPAGQGLNNSQQLMERMVPVLC